MRNGEGFVHLQQGLWAETMTVATKIVNAVATTNKPTLA